MESGELASVKISGAGTAGGGHYKEIAISGAGKVTGDVEAKAIRTSGAANFAGSVKSDLLHVSGAVTAAGDLDAASCKCSGSCRIGGSVNADTLKASGAVKIEGSANAKEADISGSVKIGGDLQGERVKLSGAIKVGGLLSADSVQLILDRGCQVREIGGGQITVLAGGRHSGWLPVFNWALRPGSLTVESVEGDDIHLEATTAKVVRGQRVKIGAGCRVGLVEYAESLQIDPDARVGEITFTGEGTPPEPDRSSVHRPDGPWSGGVDWNACIGIREIRNPLLVGLIAIAGLAIAALAIIFAMTVTGVTVGLTLGGTLLVLLLLAACIPLLILGAVVVAALATSARVVFKRSDRPRPR